jgi:hypothetical protein
MINHFHTHVQNNHNSEEDHNLLSIPQNVVPTTQTIKLHKSTQHYKERWCTEETFWGQNTTIHETLSFCSKESYNDYQPSYFEKCKIYNFQNYKVYA